MPTIPTGQMERELRALYLRWLKGVSMDSKNLTEKINRFEAQSKELIEKMGGDTARLGALAGFPAPKRLDLSPHVGTIYQDMHQAAIQAGIMIGLNSTDVARQMFNTGMDKSFHRLNRLARTETVSAYWKNAWDSVADLPALVMVWGSEDGPRTCAWCRERDGMVMESSALRDHPNGRCTPIPMLRSMVEYKGSVRADGTIYMDPAWSKKKTNGTPRDQEPIEGWPHDDRRLGAMARQEDYITKTASEMKMSPEELKATVSARAQQLVDGATPSVQVFSDDLDSILSNGFKTAWDTGTGIGGGTKDYLRFRKDLESMSWGDAKPPIYGYAQTRYNVVNGYGDVTIQLKDEIRDRSSVVFGDSLAQAGRLLPADAGSVDIYAINPDFFKSLASGSSDDVAQAMFGNASVSHKYIEMQFHGGVGVGDIDTILFSLPPSPEMRSRLETLGIPWGFTEDFKKTMESAGFDWRTLL